MLSQTERASNSGPRPQESTFTQLPNPSSRQHDKKRYKGILRTVERKEQKSIWKQINRATGNPRLGAIPLVQRMEGSEVVDIVETDKMNVEIQ